MAKEKRSKRKSWCKHYRGMHEKDACEAGVKFVDLKGHGTTGFFDSCPCFGPGSECDKAVYPTAEEQEAEEKAVEERFAMTMIARAMITESLGGPWKRGMVGSQGRIDCPNCGAAQGLRFSRSGYNGHIHASCSTGGCLSWME